MAKKNLLQRWFLDAFSAMAIGVFASLLIGTIIGQIGAWTGIEFFVTLSAYAKNGLVELTIDVFNQNGELVLKNITEAIVKCRLEA